MNLPPCLSVLEQSILSPYSAVNRGSVRWRGRHWVFGSDGELCESRGVPALGLCGAAPAPLPPSRHRSLLHLDLQF